MAQGIQTYDTHCCGIREIGAISTASLDAQDALNQLIEKELAGVSYGGWLPSNQAGTKIYSHYLFTAAVYPETTKRARMFQPYGDEFAALIEQLGLGTVISTPAVVNGAFHPDHSVKAYIWTVNQEALVAYGKKNCPLINYRKIEREIKSNLTSIASYREYLADPKRSGQPGGYYFEEYTTAIKRLEAKNVVLKEQLAAAKELAIASAKETGIELDFREEEPKQAEEVAA